MGWFVWWSRRPHRHRSGGMRALDGFDYTTNRDVFVDGVTDEEKQPHRPMPGQYDGD